MTSARQLFCHTWAAICVVAAPVCLVLVLAASCSELPDLSRGVCGNGFVDPGEDCDTFASENQSCSPPGSEFACRFECFHPASRFVSSPDAAETPNSEIIGPFCPSGSQCGTDNICRKPAGTFIQAHQPIDATVERVLLGDFQGIGKFAVIGLGPASAMGAAYARLFFLHDETHIESGLTAFPLISPTVGDISGDGRSDLVFGTASGIGVFLGQPTETLHPVAYPSLTAEKGASMQVLPIRPHPLSVFNENQVLLVSDGSTNQVLDLSSRSHVIATMPFALGELAGLPTVADIVRDPTAPCGEILFTYRDKPDIWLVQPCNTDGSWRNNTSTQIVATLPLEHTAQTAALAGDIDGDGELDLIVGSHGGAVFLSFGCNNGYFCADKGEPYTEGQMLPIAWQVAHSCINAPISMDIQPIAVGDLNGDGIADFVTSSEILIARNPTIEGNVFRIDVCQAAAKLSGRWTTAEIADINSDGKLDVVAASLNDPDIEIYTGTGTDRLNMTRIVTPYPVMHMAVGDFDGDLLSDIAVALAGTEDSQTGQTANTLAIAFGNVSSIPDPVVDVAMISHIAQVVSAHIDNSGAIEALGVVGFDDAGRQTLTVLSSHGGRGLLAPYRFHGQVAGFEPNSEQEEYPISNAMGDFDGDGQLDIASLTVPRERCEQDNCRIRLRVTRSVHQARLSQLVVSDFLPNDFALFGTNGSARFEMAAFVRAADMEGNGTVDPVFLMPWNQDATQTIIGRAILKKTGNSIVLEKMDTLSRTHIQLSSISHPILHDLDGDGQLDIIALSGTMENRKLVVAWGEPDGGGFREPELVTLEEPPSAFALIQADATAWKNVVVVADKAAYLLWRESEQPRTWLVRLLADMPGGKSVAVGDIDGDGIDDIVVAEARGIGFYRGQAVLP